MSQDNTLDNLLTLIQLDKKREVEKLARRISITSEGLADLILAGHTLATAPYLYQCHFDERVPEHLPPTKEDLAALATSGVGPMQGRAIKASNKIGQIFRERRLLSVHLFYLADHSKWSLFYFDQRDFEFFDNHWKHGPHIHFSCNFMSRDRLGEVWKKVCERPSVFPKSIHVRYDYHHNRKYSDA